MVRAVLDANVVVSGRLNDAGPPGRILALFLGSGEFQWVLSPAIYAEYQRAFGYERVARYFRDGPHSSREWLDRLANLALWVEDEPGFPRTCADPDDDKYLAAAREGMAHFIISGDTDLLELGSFADIPILTPGRFLKR